MGMLGPLQRGGICTWQFKQDKTRSKRKDTYKPNNSMISSLYTMYVIKNL